jgi:hypothetical protein
MNVNDPKIVSLRATVKAAQQEFDMAVMFHEMWKPAAYDEALHKRMGVLRHERFPRCAVGAPTGDVARIDTTLGPHPEKKRPDGLHR